LLPQVAWHIKRKTLLAMFNMINIIYCFILEYESWLPWQRPLKIRTSRFKSFIYSRAEPNGENRVKIRPVEIEIKRLTETVKKK